MRDHLDLQGDSPSGVMLPIHRGTCNLAPHPWDEPAEGTVTAAAEAGARIAVPCPGEPFEPTSDAVPTAPWWRSVAAPGPGGRTSEAVRPMTSAVVAQKETAASA